MRKLFRAVAAAAALLVVAAGAVVAPGGSALAACYQGPVTVTVTDGYGRPVAGAQVGVANDYPSADDCGQPGSPGLSSQGVTGADGRWSGHIPLVAPDPSGDLGLSTNGVGWRVDATLTRTDGVREDASWSSTDADVVEVQAEGGRQVIPGTGGSGALAYHAYLPVIEGPATLRAGQVAAYELRLPSAASGLIKGVTWSAGGGLAAAGGASGDGYKVKAASPGDGYVEADLTVANGGNPDYRVTVSLDVRVLPPAPPSITLEGPRELLVGSRGGYLAYPQHAVGPVRWSIDGERYGELSPAGAAAVLRAKAPGYVTVVAEVQGEGGQVARASERVRIVAPPGPPVWEILLPLLLVLLLLLLILAARRRRRAREDGTA